MICEDCRGEGMILAAGMVVPCGTCHGSGLDYCCGGVPHIPYTDCWCKPVEDPDEPGVFIHQVTLNT